MCLNSPSHGLALKKRVCESFSQSGCKITHFIWNSQIFQMIFILSVIIVRYRKLNGDFFAAMIFFLYLCPQI